ncbi:MAG: trypsin-like peptidase domain-containing protein, partial [Patescibacteria group bacterium]|nr:trypsin-like peptidase domain-containing protein [Patescibacteria group bacterium]
MRRLTYLLAVTAAVGVALFLVAAYLRARVPTPPAPVVVAPPAATTTASAPAPAAPLPSAPTPLPASAPAAAGSAVGQIAARAAASAALEGALVNILCIAPAGSAFHSISASGVVVTPSGYVLTSAHVAAYFLLADQGVSCVLRAGSPAKDAYTASLAYISPDWVARDSALLLEASPTDTGEYDFALLAITGGASKAPLPSPLPFVPLAAASPAAGDAVVVGSYGAQGLSAQAIETALSPTLVPGAVAELLTFDSTTPDVIAVAGSAAAEEGSSGGGVATLDGALAGSITTSSNTGSIASRTLSALSAS